MNSNETKKKDEAPKNITHYCYKFGIHLSISTSLYMLPLCHRNFKKCDANIRTLHLDTNSIIDFIGLNPHNIQPTAMAMIV